MTDPSRWMHQVLAEAGLLHHDKEATKWVDYMGCTLSYLAKDGRPEGLSRALGLKPMEAEEFGKAVELISSKKKGQARQAIEDRDV